MTGQMTTHQLREQLTAHLDAVTPPPPDLDAVRRRSRSSKARRLAGPGLLTAAAVGIGALVLSQATGPTGPDTSKDEDTVVATEEPLDLSKGLRAYASPGESLHMAGRELPDSIEGLDTDAVATPVGIVFYDADGWPWLLPPDGQWVQLDAGASEPAEGFHPTVKADAARPHVTYALMAGDDVTITVYDLERRSVVASTDITCEGGCADLVIDGIDSGAVFLRGKDATTVWDYETGERSFFAGPETRVADVRNGVVLYDGPAPTAGTGEWRLVSGAIDAQLTFDGRHVLYWSDELTSTAARGTSVIKLDLPVPATFFTFDTDGSVLAATVDDPSKVFDCEIPSGTCEQIGEMSTDHGDPVLIGSDM